MTANLKTQLTQQFRAHSSREQAMLLLMMAVIACCGVYYGAWKPMQAKLAAAQAYYQSERSLAQWMAAQSPGGEADAQSLTGSFAPFQLTPTKIDTGKGGMIAITLKNTSFNRLVDWLDMAQRRYRLVPVSMSVTRNGEHIDAVVQLKKS